jgi:tRNA nucleotidyltransferase (CCA-adding enzyme)
MRSPAETTTPEASIEDALAQLVEAGVGRLPVIRAGKIVGIVTRTDLLRALYREAGRSS